MPVTTWTYASNYEGWTFNDDSRCPGCSATRSYVTGAIRNTLVLDNVPNTSSVGQNFTSGPLNVANTAGDSVAADLSATSDANDSQVNIIIYFTDGTSEMSPATVFNGATTKTYVITTAGKLVDMIEVRIARSTGAGGVGSTHYVDLLEVRYTTTNAVSSSAGLLKTPFDFIESQEDGASGGVGGGSGGIAGISPDGLFIYIAAFNNLGQPTLVKISAALTADGTVVFEPGAGGRIGVECARYNTDHLWVFGEFDSTNTVEKSEDAGSSFTVKDNATFGAIRSFSLSPNDDNRILMYDGDNGQLIGSSNGASSWVAVNAAVSQLVNSIAQFSENNQEVVIGNQGAANDTIDYSPNFGVDLEDYQTGVFPATDTTRVIAE